MRIGIVDGQGGGIGKTIVSKLKSKFKDDIEIIALGTNSLATSAMLKAGADCGTTGENAIIVTSKKIDVLIGPVAIISANSMMGEISPLIANAISDSSAEKFLIPLNRCGIHIVGTEEIRFNTIIDSLIENLTDFFKNK